MPTSLLQILNDILLALLLLFFLRVLRAVWVQVNPPAPAPAPTSPVAPAAPARPPAAPVAAAVAHLRVVEPAAARGTVYDVGEEVTVGRAPGCGVALPDQAVSQLHARLYRRDGKLWLEDLGSTNGTWVNQKRISAPLAIRRGDRIQVGATVLEVSR